MSVTIKDVAREANVSPSTVSRVISNSPRISDETKEKVNRIIKKLNYHPNVIARSLANNTTNVIGIILTSEIDDLTKNPFFIQVMTGISTYAKEKGYYIMYTFCTTYEEELKCAKNYVNGNLVDGIILSAVVDNDKCIQYLKDIQFPFVVIGRPENTNNILWVDNDNFKAMYNVVSKFLLRGYKNVAFIGPKIEMSVAKDRLSGYIQAHKINGVEINKNFIKEVPAFKEEYGYESMKEIIKSEIPEAVVAADDLLAFGAIRYLHENKMENTSVVGFNNTPQAEYYRPSLTSVDINVKKVGYYASKLLVDRLKNNVKENHYIVETNLVERETTNFGKNYTQLK
ncbi:LacI family DNA-binding transcriptional regulator [Clostridium neuense]|uniref:LacI family DNA-binding transcriptional regulator n=1 Tax=Clostridium neuense TaxID=1728934 RepID=A0ABW8TKJ6_9CLOT